MADGDTSTKLDPVDVLTYDGWQRANDRNVNTASATEKHFAAEPQPEHERVPADKVKVREWTTNIYEK